MRCWGARIGTLVLVAVILVLVPSFALANSFGPPPPALFAIALAASSTPTRTATRTLTPTRKPTATYTPDGAWIFCALAGQVCSFSGTKNVRYGAEGKYSYRTLTNSTPCTNAVFGDPAPGIPKKCHYGGALPNATPTKTQTPTPTLPITRAPTATSTRTATRLLTNTPTRTFTTTATKAATSTPTWTVTNTRTATRTATRTRTPTPPPSPTFTWTPTLTPNPTPSPTGPEAILLLTSASAPTSAYLREILVTEGFGSVESRDVAQLGQIDLRAFALVIVGPVTTTSEQAQALAAYMQNDGGKVILIRPTGALRAAFGAASGQTLSDSWYKTVNTMPPGQGLVDLSLQFHGDADLYDSFSGDAAAWLYSDANTPTTYPALILAKSASGGQAAIFAFDVAKSVILTRQGNPAWAGVERDGSPPIRAVELFTNIGRDSTPDYVARERIGVPQADELQRLLTNTIELLSAEMPLPRAWYLPFDYKAAVLMTGDNHGADPVPQWLDMLKNASAPGCMVANWECYRGSVYLWPGTSPLLPPADAERYSADGFEIGVHFNTNCQDWTPASLDAAMNAQLQRFLTWYPTLPSPASERTHCIPWSDWASLPQTDAKYGIRMENGYYYFPAAWVNNTPGYFTGSALPMRFADANWNVINVYQAATQMTDESGQEYPFTVDTLLDNALGAEGFYGMLTANMHASTNLPDGLGKIIASAQARGVPIVSARQALTWVEARAGSYETAPSWIAPDELEFRLSVNPDARGLVLLLPAQTTRGRITSIVLDGTALPFQFETIKGIEYATFAGTTGDVIAIYQ